MSRAISILILFLIASFSFSQTKSQKLKTQQQKLEKQISYSKKLLSQIKSNSENSLNELKLIESQIKNREELVAIYDNQVRLSEIKIIEKEQEIKALEQKLKLLVQQYKKMLLHAYKNRNNQAKAIYVLSSNSYNEALQRNQYLKKIKAIQKRQVVLIKQHQELIKNDIADLEGEKDAKISAIKSKKEEREEIAKDKILKESIFNKYKDEENRLNELILADETKRAELKKKVDEAIRQEIYQAKKREEERLRKLKEKQKNKTNQSSEGSVVGTSFYNNKGKLPWPVNNGQITEKYGKNPHPTLKGVTTINNGIDITSKSGSSVRSVFMGTVSSVFEIPGSGKGVIIKHGNYMTVYSNLQTVTVNKGDAVSEKQNIGTLIKNGNSSTCHFEIHYISNGVPQTMNPSLWIGR